MSTKIILFALLILTVYSVYQYFRITQKVQAAQHLLNSTVAYQQDKPVAKLKILILGDSSAVGVGATKIENSTAGRFGRDYPEAQITNLGISGLRVAALDEKFDPAKESRYNLVIAQIGANDIFHFTPLKQVENHLISVVRKAKQAGEHVVILHGGNFGAGDVLPWPSGYLFSWRTRQVRKIYQRVAASEGAIYADLYTSLKDFAHIRNGQDTYAVDGFHPSDEGYALWYERIRSAMNTAGVVLEPR